MIITSRENGLLKNIRKIKDKNKKSDFFIIEGLKIINEAILENQKIDLIVITESKQSEYKYSDYKNIIVKDSLFKELSDTVNSQGIIAVVKKQKGKSLNYDSEYIMILEDIQDPGNLGTIIRTLDSANINQLIITKNTANPFSSKVIRSTMGSIFRVNIIEIDDIINIISELKNKGFNIITTDLNANKNIYELDYNKSVVIIGNEGNGVSKKVIDASDSKVIIPMLGKTESLNAGVSASIMIYEYVRKKVQNEKY